MKESELKLEHLKEIVRADQAWLNLNDNERNIALNINPLSTIYDDEPMDFARNLLKVITKTEYIHLLCKLIFDFNVLPIQNVILQEIWQRPYPMLIQNRGGGKTSVLALYCFLRAMLKDGIKIVISAAGFRQAKLMMEYMENLWNKAPVFRDICNKNSGLKKDIDRYVFRVNNSTITAIPLGDGCLSKYNLITYHNTIGNPSSYHIDESKQTNYITRKVYCGGEFNNSNESYYNGEKDIYRLITKKGYQLEATLNHKVKILRNNKIEWCELENINFEKDKILIDHGIRWHNGQTELSVDDGYLCGLMIGDGSWTNKNKLQFTSKDNEMIQFVSNYFKPLKELVTYDDVHYFIHSTEIVNTFISKFNLKPRCYTIDKEIPFNILNSNKEVVRSCLQGLFDTDGTLQVTNAKGGWGISVSFTNTSKKLIDQIQYLLLHFGIISTIKTRNRNIKWNTIYELYINGHNVKLFSDLIGFRLTRKQDKLLHGLSLQKRDNSYDDNLDCLDILRPILKKYKIHSKYAKGCKTLTRKIGKEIYELLKDKEDLEWLNNLLKDHIFYDEPKLIEYKGKEKCYDLCVEGTHEYCANGFIVHNSTIRGMRANIIINDEFGATRPDIYEVVISGFTAVTANPFENVVRMAKKNFLKKNNLWLPEYDQLFKVQANQSIIAGTAGYDFEHFADYWRRYKKIVESCGDKNILKEIYKDGIPEDFHWEDYSVIRIPYELMPEGFMDAKSVARSKAVNTDGNYLTEYGSVFIKDSNGFFKRSLIESCVTSDKKLIRGIWFDISTVGHPKLKYVISCDPASEKDNFAITVIEMREDHNRLVYCWTTNRQAHLRLVEKGMIKENNFYAYCARKIRSLMAVFPTVKIAIDQEGGGRAVNEALHDKDKIQPGEQLLWPVIDPEKESPTDIKEGLHIIELINFAKSDWVNEANHGLKKDMEDKILLFPRFDCLSLGLASEMDGIDNDNSDSLENLIYEIEELKDELCSIVHTKSTIAGRDRWDTPEVKTIDGKKTRSRKDRYSALLMANMVARQINRADAPISFGLIGAAIDKSNRVKIKQEKTIGNNFYSVGWDTFKGIKRR